VAEGTGLENRHTGNGIVSSNLTLSVGHRIERRSEAIRGAALQFSASSSKPVPSRWPHGSWQSSLTRARRGSSSALRMTNQVGVSRRGKALSNAFIASVASPMSRIHTPQL
jgi:hypothetical protein